MEEDQDWFDKPSEERNLKEDPKGLDTLLCTHVRHWKGRYGLRDDVEEKGILPCVGCVGIVETKPGEIL